MYTKTFLYNGFLIFNLCVLSYGVTAQYIVALDLGTTNAKCQVISNRGLVVGSATVQTPLTYPKPGFVEIEPGVLWHNVLKVISVGIRNAQLRPLDITCLSITTQRGSFITWRKDTGEPLHNFITWKDTRSKGLVEQWNNSKLVKLTKLGAGLINVIIKQDRFETAKNMKLSTNQCTLRLLWVFENIPEVKKHAKNQNLQFGTLDTWLVYKFTGGKKFISEVTHASATGIYDPFTMGWSTWINKLFSIPMHILPEVVDSDYDFGSTVPELFGGASIPIKAVLADQQASLFATTTFKANEVKVTMGTGSFIDITVGDTPTAGGEGSYPLVACTLGGATTYLIEASCSDAGSLIQWGIQTSIIKNISTLSDDISALNDSDGVFFVPAFSGLPAPFSNERAAAGFLGIKPTTTNLHLARAILESIVYTIVSSYWMLQEHKHRDFEYISVDGGISNNNFVCQLLADLLGLDVVRYTTTNDTILGAALIAGLNAGIWKSLQEVKSFRRIERVFKPADKKNPRVRQQTENWSQWKKAIERFKDWND